MIAMMPMEELMAESNTFTKFNKTVELIFDNMEDIDMSELEPGAGEDATADLQLPQEILINKFQLQDLTAETAKLKSSNNMESISVDKLVKLLNILELNIRDGSKVCPLATGEEEDSEEDSLFLEVSDVLAEIIDYSS